MTTRRASATREIVFCRSFEPVAFLKLSEFQLLDILLGFTYSKQCIDSFRLPYDRFVTRYRCIVSDWWILFPRKGKHQLIPQAMGIAERIGLHEQIACGKTQVFMKTGHVRKLDQKPNCCL